MTTVKAVNRSDHYLCRVGMFPHLQLSSAGGRGHLQLLAVDGHPSHTHRRLAPFLAARRVHAALSSGTLCCSGQCGLRTVLLKPSPNAGGTPRSCPAPALCGCPSISAPVCSSGLQSSAHLPRATRGPRLLPQKHPANPSMTNTSSGIRLSEESVKGNSRVQGSLGTGPSPPSLTSMPAVLVRVTSSGGRSLSRPRVPAASLPAPCLLPVVST